jgi:serine/threonine protein phosphatase PrpC
MQLHYDHFVTIGKTHKVCEDYVTKGDKPTPFLILSDGCSSSARSEIGAKILSMTAKYMIEHDNNQLLSYVDFGNQLIGYARQIVSKMQLPDSVLDATVLLAVVQAEYVIIYVYGDGCLLLKDWDGYVKSIEIAFTHNAPYYLTYWNEPEGQRQYAKYDSHPLVLIDSIDGRSALKPFASELIFRFPFSQYQTIAIASDGVTQCIDTYQRFALPLDGELANQLLNFQHTDDHFVADHLQQLLEGYAKQGIYPADDLSIAAFVQV